MGRRTKNAHPSPIRTKLVTVASQHTPNPPCPPLTFPTRIDVEDRATTPSASIGSTALQHIYPDNFSCPEVANVSIGSADSVPSAHSFVQVNTQTAAPILVAYSESDVRRYLPSLPHHLVEFQRLQQHSNVGAQIRVAAKSKAPPLVNFDSVGAVPGMRPPCVSTHLNVTPSSLSSLPQVSSAYPSNKLGAVKRRLNFVDSKINDGSEDFERQKKRRNDTLILYPNETIAPPIGQQGACPTGVSLPPSAVNCSLIMQPVLKGVAGNGQMYSVAPFVKLISASTAVQGQKRVHDPIQGQVGSDSELLRNDWCQKNDGTLIQTTKRFMQYLQQCSHSDLDLNVTALKINCPKRRLYDITNVLEGVGLLEKVSKNRVQWTSKQLEFNQVQVAHVKNEVDDLEREEKMLDEVLQSVQSLYETEIEDCINNRFGYVSHEQVRQLDFGPKKLLIFVNGPKNTELSVYSPQKVAVRSESAAVNVCITCSDQQAQKISSEQQHTLNPSYVGDDHEKALNHRHQTSCTDYERFCSELCSKVTEIEASTRTNSGLLVGNSVSRPSSAVGALSSATSSRISPVDDVSRDSGLDSPSTSLSLCGSRYGETSTTPVLPFTCLKEKFCFTPVHKAAPSNDNVTGQSSLSGFHSPTLSNLFHSSQESRDKSTERHGGTPLTLSDLVSFLSPQKPPTKFTPVANQSQWASSGFSVNSPFKEGLGRFADGCGEGYRFGMDCRSETVLDLFP